MYSGPAPARVNPGLALAAWRAGGGGLTLTFHPLLLYNISSSTCRAPERMTLRVGDTIPGNRETVFTYLYRHLSFVFVTKIRIISNVSTRIKEKGHVSLRFCKIYCISPRI